MRLYTQEDYKKIDEHLNAIREILKNGISNKTVYKMIKHKINKYKDEYDIPKVYFRQKTSRIEISKGTVTAYYDLTNEELEQFDNEILDKHCNRIGLTREEYEAKLIREKEESEKHSARVVEYNLIKDSFDNKLIDLNARFKQSYSSVAMLQLFKDYVKCGIEKETVLSTDFPDIFTGNFLEFDNDKRKKSVNYIIKKSSDYYKYSIGYTPDSLDYINNLKLSDYYNNKKDEYNKIVDINEVINYSNKTKRKKYTKYLEYIEMARLVFKNSYSDFDFDHMIDWLTEATNSIGKSEIKYIDSEHRSYDKEEKPKNYLTDAQRNIVNKHSGCKKYDMALAMSKMNNW